MSTSTRDMELPDIDISPLKQALSQLEIALQARAKKPNDALIRDAVIQRFEFTYELSVRMLRRYLKHIAASDDEVNELTFRELIRRANEVGLLQGGVPEWAEFRQARTDTVHTYNELRAAEVAAAAKEFAREAHVLFDNLSRRLNG